MDENFKYGFGVRKWFSRKIGRKTYAIGLKDTGLEVLVFGSNGTVVKMLNQG